MDAIAITVIIPVFNCFNYIEKCIKSVIAQTPDNIEIIVLDDFSTDHTVENIPNDPRIKVIKNKK